MTNNRTDFRFIDLFAGIGGFHIAMHGNGGKCVFASEIDKFARKTYEHNFKRISPEIFKNGHFNEDITDPELDYSKIPDFEILCAGFPCQPFSHAGLKKGFDDTRGTLFFNIKEIVRAKIEANKLDKKVTVPKVLLLENVKGFKNHDKGNTFKVIKRTLNDLGYEVAAEVLNSKHFGVPQNRERIFIVAWHRKLVRKTNFKFPFGLNGNNEVIYEKEKRDEEAKRICVGDILLNDSELEELEARDNKTYTISERLCGQLWRIVGKGFRVTSKKTLQKLNYPSPGRSNYLVVRIEKVNTPEFKDVYWDFKKLRNYKKGIASAFPFTTTLTELMKNKIK